VRYPIGQPERAYYFSDIESTNDLFYDYFHFYISNPKTGTQCRGCAQVLDPLKISIRTQIIYSSTYIPVSFCLTKSCLELGLQRYTNQINTCKGFHNIIWVYQKDLEEVKSLLPDIILEVIPSFIYPIK